MKVRLTRRSVVRVIASAMCFLALLVFAIGTPNRASADDCCYCMDGGVQYSPGACLKHAICACGQPPNCGCAWVGYCEGGDLE